MGYGKIPLGPLGYLDILSPQGAILQSPNTIPTLEEASFAHALLANTESELYQLHLDIAILLSKRAHVLKRITKCKAILSPHKNLPSELVSKIFSFVVVQPYALFPLRYGKRDLRLQITQVCSRWRKIAFDTPGLWDLCFPPFYGGPGIELGAAWWSQYAGSTLRLSVTHKPEIIPNPKLDFLLIDKLVLPFSEHLREVDMAVSTRGLKKLLSVRPGSFDNLESIDISARGRVFEPWSEEDAALVSAPNLRSVSLSVSTQSWFSPNLPWGQLTQLSLTIRIPGNVFVVLLAKCTALVSCDLSSIDDENMGPVTEAETSLEIPLCLPLLDSFSVHFRSGGFSHLLSRLSLPNLSGFTITTNITHHENHWTCHCRPFFQSMEASLRHVEIISSVENPWQVNPLDDTIFWDFPNIQSFIAPSYHPLGPSTLDKIARGEILRKIKILEFYTENAVDVANMLSARQSDALSSNSGSISSVGNIQVYCRESADGVEEKLNFLRSQGVVIDCIIPYSEPETGSDDSDSSE